MAVDYLDDWMRKYPKLKEKIRITPSIEQYMRKVAPWKSEKVGDDEWNELVSRLIP
jgi:hypothetical protein